MKSSSRPPDQYKTAKGTSFLLIPNEYDKNSYGQCNYASYRTLIRCKQIRSKEELARNCGQCGEHVEFAKTLEENHKREVMRTHAENDTRMQRSRFDPWISSNECISDEDEYLQAVQTLPSELREPVTDNILDSHPLRYAGYFTDKDVLRIKIDMIQKDIDDLSEFKSLVVHQAQKEHDQMLNDEDYDGPNDLPQRRVFKAAKNYSRGDYLRLTKTVDPVFNKCIVGPNMDDHNMITHVVHTLLDTLDNFKPIPIQEPCKNPALHLSKFCAEHITLDRRQKMFTVCRVCGVPAMDLDDRLCTFHIKLHTIGSADCPCERCVESTGASREQPKVEEIFDEDLGNLSRIEEMVSPLQQFSIPPLSSPSSSYPPLPRPRYPGSPARPPPSNKTAAQRVVASMGGFQHAQRIRMEEQMKLEQEELKSQTCASLYRVRPIEHSQYGSGKKIPEQQFQKFTSPGVSPYKKPPTMPSILSNASPYSGARPPAFPGWRGSASSGSSSLRAMHQQTGATTCYPIHRPPPKSIPLDRAQEPKTGDELVEDRGSPPRAPEPQRRGVPYYKNMSAYKRTEPMPRYLQSSSSTSSSPSSFLLPVAPGPPPPPSAPRFRAPGARPMAPHRAIAAGLNPADVPSPARPVYRVAPTPPVPAYHQPPVPRRQMVPPHRMPATPTKVTTAYTVVGPAAAPRESPSRLADPELDTARHDARFANINVKTFLSMSKKDLDSMTQEEIDLLATSPHQPKKGPKKEQKEEEDVPTTSESSRSSKKRKIDETIAEVVESIASSSAPEPVVAPSAPEAPSAPVASAPVAPPAPEAAPAPAVAPVAPEAPPPTSSGEPPAKKAAKKERNSEEPKKSTSSKKSTPPAPTPSGRTPRAAAVAANQAIVHQKPSTSSASTSASNQAANNPLDLLAELSEAAAFEEQKALETPAKKKNAKKTSPKQRASSSSKEL